MKYLVNFISFVFLFSFSSFAQNGNDDSTFVSPELDFQDFSRNLDSMLSLWYVQGSINPTGNGNNFNVTNDTVTVPYYSDEMYMERLARMNTYFEMTYNETVRKYIEFYSLKRRRQVEVMLGLSEYYFPIFEQALDKYGLPLELKFLPIIESALNPRAISRAGASGLWQFMYTTGKIYKLNVSSFVDERQDPAKASDAAARYLKDLYDIYHDWQLVIAAYNCGPGNVNKAIKRTGKTTYWGIYDRLPRETRGYVPAFIGAAFTMSNYRELKLVPRKIEMPTATDTIHINQELHLLQVSEVLQIPIEKIRQLNPQYKKDIIPANFETFPLMLPSDYITQFITLKDSIFTYKDSVFFSSVRPNQYGFQGNNNKSTNSNGDVRLTYTVKSGDSFGVIANKFHVTTADIKSWNNIKKNRLIAGQKLSIYVPEGSADKYKKYQNEKAKTENKTQTVTNNTDNVVKGDYVYYTVKSGDNFYTISKKYTGVTAEEIMKINGITNARSLKIGQKLKIKKKE
ncbi:MAG: transglycosylase SLT domain-containing protein [Bacteroidia bacterium]|nr:transglycosylase SLT domain-containing protein [Bacteroidia bacterium]